MCPSRLALSSLAGFYCVMSHAEVSAVEQQVKENEESAAAQKLMDLQSADDIITTR